MYKFKKILAFLVTSMLLLTACGENAEQSDEIITEITTTTAITTETTESELTLEENLESHLFSGDGTRLKNILSRAENGEKITIGFLGGSITEGLTSGAEKCYARLTYNKLCESYQNGEIDYINAGMSGTPSVLGAARAEYSLLNNDFTGKNVPDIFILEYAVNDGQETIYKEAYESLVRRFLELPNEPAVVLLINILENGYSAKEHMKAIGEHYSLPMLSMADLLTEKFESGELVWTDYSDDQSHPNDFGHALIADEMMKLFDLALENASGNYSVPENDKFSSPYKNLHYVDRTNIGEYDIGMFKETVTSDLFPNGWQLDRESTSENGLTLTVNTNSFFVIYKENNTNRYGAFDVFANGEKVATVETNKSDGWGQPVAANVLKKDNISEYTIEIKPSEGMENTFIEILGLAY